MRSSLRLSLPPLLLLVSILGSAGAAVAATVASTSTSSAGTAAGAAAMAGLYAPGPRASWARHIVALHDAKATFDFCGGMMFQLVLSDALRAHLLADSAAVTVHGAAVKNMAQVPGYAKSAAANDVELFHGREVRKVQGAAGGMGFVLHLALSSERDEQGWSAQEKADYNGWGHDGGRPWRNASSWAREGVAALPAWPSPGSGLVGLHHRCYWHTDSQGRLWLAAEDGCEGFAFDASAAGTRRFGL